MATPLLQSALISGEVAPSIFGRVDIDRERVAASTARNMFVNYRGPAYSRAGTKFCGPSKQTGRNFPPRMVPFQFSIDQGLALEFGDHYMRVVFDGAFVTEGAVAIGGASQSDPAVLTFGAEGATAGTPNDGAVTFSYAPGDKVTLAGGTALTPAVLQVTTSQLVSIIANAPGTGYAVNDTVTLAGGTSSVSAVAKVTSLVSVAAAGSVTFPVNPADGDTVTLNGVTWTFKTTVSGSAQTEIQPTLDATMAQLAADLNASSDASLIVATYGATGTALTVVYDTPGTGGNAYTLAASVGTPSSATLTGGSATGIGLLTINTAGVFSALPSGANMTQASTSGGGSGASFQTAVFGPHAVSISNPGAYTVLPANPVAQASTTGIGVGATFTMTWAAIAAFNNGDWLFITDVEGMTELNGNFFIVAGATSSSVQLLDIYGNQVDSSGFNAYTGGGTASRVYTLDTPYAEEDLPYLKFTQSADVMSICCVNQQTGTEYAPQDLSRISDTDWSFSSAVGVSSVSPPASASASITAPDHPATFYQYVVTAVSPDDGSESVASPIASTSGVDIGTQAGQVNLKWGAVAEVNQYNIYKAQPSYSSDVPAGALFGYIGSAYGTQFSDKNILGDYAQVPPLHKDPFARGQVIGVNIVTGGSGYSQSTATATITSSTGSGAKLEVVVVSGAIAAVIINDAGSGYAAGDTVTLHGGSGATATLVIGAQTGTYPGTVAYFQERRAYANSLNQTDTYWMSQPGAFKNFDSRIPPIDTDAIIGSPWSVQVNGIQWMIQTSGGLLVMTGLSAWLLVGAGSFATNVQAISPSTQDDVPQAFTGVSPTVPPIKINYDVLYVNSKGSYYYALPYQLYVLSEPIDLTEIAAHLFTGFTILENAWCEQPFKLLWAVRDDGVLLSLTYYKSQQVSGWARHDTNGQFKSVCSITEPPVDALYLATQRFPGGRNTYMIERMDNRIWQTVEDSWCVDVGLSLPQPTPNATLSASSATGLGTITGVTGLVGGSGYSGATTATVIDNVAPGIAGGSGATATVTVAAGVITAVNITAPGSGYLNPRLEFLDPSNGGSGAAARPVLNTTAIFTASSAVFGIGDIGSVIRMGGGIATITGFTDSSHVNATITTPITAVLPNSGIPPARPQVAPQAAGTWTLSVPVSQIFGLDHLIGATVTGLADGHVITPRIVAANGSITLDTPASAVTVGLGFQAQLQSVYLDAGAPTVQGQRKKVAAVSALLEASRDVSIGANQPDGSTLSPIQLAPVWSNMDAVPNLVPAPYNGTVEPLFTGYVRIPVTGGFQKPGQVALQQNNPLPMNVLALVPEGLEGDTPEQQAQPKQGRGGGGQ